MENKECNMVIITRNKERICIFTLWLIFLITIKATNSYAQFGPGSSIPNNAGMPLMGWNQYNTRGNATPRDRWNSERYLYTVQLKNDSAFQIQTFIDFATNKHFFNFKSEGVLYSIVPTQTKSLSRITEEGFKLVGIPNDSCWLFPVEFGKINTYSPLSEMKAKYVTAIQKEGGLIMPLTKGNLLAMMSEPSIEVMKLIERKKLTKAVQAYNTVKKKH
jgi:hypothetical protein